jgi:hypothetical protein
MSRDEQHAFLSTTLFISGALLAWLGAFSVVYVFAAIACAKAFAQVQLLGLPIVPLVTTTTIALTAVLTVVLLRRGAARLRAQATSEHGRFLGFVAFATSAIAIIALVLLALPPLLMTACRT